MAERLIREIEETLGADPDSGEPLSGEFKGFFRYRIGEYRVIFSRYPDSVLILRIGQ
jgi:mRNA-degrading endonuclease RelE of RelBE toxin-antitoxin system